MKRISQINISYPAVFLIIAIGLSLLIRLYGLPFMTSDSRTFLRYLFAIRSTDGNVLGVFFTKLSSPYIYMIALAELLPFQPIVALKSILVIFDYLIALLAYIWVRYYSPQNAIKAAVLLLFCPTLIINAAYWGQLDIVYTSFLLLSVFLFGMAENEKSSKMFLYAMMSYAIAFSFKLQAVFLLPFICFFLGKNLQYLPLLLLMPVVYILTVLPRVYYGFDLDNLFRDYNSQINAAGHNAPTFFRMLNINALLFEYKCWIGLSTGCIISLGCFIAGYRSRAKQFFIANIWLGALLCLLAVPYVMPSIHERYYFPADILSIILLFIVTKSWYWLVPIVITGCSLLSYLPYLMGLPDFHRPTSFVIAAVIVLISFALRDERRSSPLR